MTGAAGAATGGGGAAEPDADDAGAGEPDPEPGELQPVFVTAAAEEPRPGADWPAPGEAALGEAVDGALAGDWPLGEDEGAADVGRSLAGADVPGACVAREKTEPAAGG